MTAELPQDLKLNGKYNKSATARILGISRTTLDKYISLGWIAVELNKKKNTLYIKGTSIMKFFNS